MKKIISIAVFVFLLAGFNSMAVAKKDEAPAGWSKGEKKSWNGEAMPPGQQKKIEKQMKKEEQKKKNELRKQEKEKRAQKMKDRADDVVNKHLNR